MNIEKEADSCYDAPMKVLAYADLRKHLADDEHRDPLPIYGSARLFDRLPVAQRRDYTPKERLRLLREQMSSGMLGLLYPGDGEGYVSSANNEEGC